MPTAVLVDDIDSPAITFVETVLRDQRTQFSRTPLGADHDLADRLEQAFTW
jgi:hypothetical protein